MADERDDDKDDDDKVRSGDSGKPGVLNASATQEAMGELRQLILKARQNLQSLSAEERARAEELLDKASNTFECYREQHNEVAERDGEIAKSYLWRSILKFIDTISLPAIMSVFIARKVDYAPNKEASAAEENLTVAANSATEAALSSITGKVIVGVAYERANLLIGLKNLRSEVNPDVKKPGVWQRLGTLWNGMLVEEVRSAFHGLKQWAARVGKAPGYQPEYLPRSTAADKSLLKTAEDIDRAYLDILGQDGYLRRFDDVNPAQFDKGKRHFRHLADATIQESIQEFQSKTGQKERD